MFGLSFLNPAFLTALALAGIPLIMHLIRKRKVRVVQWAAWDFLFQSTRRVRRRVQLENILLLLLRTLIIALVVLAFCRPLIQMIGAKLVGSNARIHAVIVLDNSFSMGYKSGGKTDFDRARAVAENVLTSVLKQGDSASLVLASSQPVSVLKEPNFDLRRVRERVRNVQISDRSTDFAAAADLTARILRPIKTQTKEVYWITDNQRAGFGASGDDRGRAAWKEISEQARVTWIGVGPEKRENVAVDAPHFGRELVTPQAPVRIEAAIHNHSDRARSGLLVNLEVDGRPVGSSRIDVPARGTTKASFIHLFEKPGAHAGSIQLGQPDGLERDNKAVFAAKVREQLRVLIVNPQPASDPVRDEAFYIATALAPVAASEGGSVAIAPTVRGGSSLSGVDLRTYDAVVVTGLPAFGPADHEALADFVRNGGGVLLYPGPKTDGPRATAALGGSGGLMPGSLGARRSLPESAAVTLNPATIRHPALASFRDTREINLGSARFTDVWEIEPPKGDPETRVLLQFSGGQPAFLERQFGQGKVILAASTAGITGNNLPFKPAFVPVVHQLVAYLAAGPTAHRSLPLGATLAARYDVRDAGKGFRITLPSGQVRALPSKLGSDGVTVSFSGTGSAGLYKIGMDGRGITDTFAINLPVKESDLTPVTERDVRSALALPPSRLAYAGEGTNLVALVNQARRGTEIWRNLILAVLPLLFLESLLAQRWGRAG